MLREVALTSFVDEAPRIDVGSARGAVRTDGPLRADAYTLLSHGSIGRMICW